jgi:hypothetical protein
MKYPIIADSGANFHMFKEHEFFDSLAPAMGHVILGDGETKLPIQGVGTIKCKIGVHIIFIEGVHCVPELSKSIYSLILHIQHPGHGLQSFFDNGLYIQFPYFQTNAILGTDDIYLDAIPVSLNQDSTIFMNISSLSSNQPVMDQALFCQKVTRFQDDINIRKKPRLNDSLIMRFQLIFVTRVLFCRLIRIIHLLDAHL